jgi:hypothetical protein
MRKSQLKKASGSGGANRILALPVDQIGAWTSALCLTHCLLTPVVLSISAVSALSQAICRYLKGPVPITMLPRGHTTLSSLPQRLISKLGVGGS